MQAGMTMVHFLSWGHVGDRLKMLWDPGRLGHDELYDKNVIHVVTPKGSRL
jgi:hypothetical protein